MQGYNEKINEYKQHIFSKLPLLSKKELIVSMSYVVEAQTDAVLLENVSNYVQKTKMRHCYICHKGIFLCFVCVCVCLKQWLSCKQNKKKTEFNVLGNINNPCQVKCNNDGDDHDRHEHACGFWSCMECVRCDRCHKVHCANVGWCYIGKHIGFIDNFEAKYPRKNPARDCSECEMQIEQEAEEEDDDEEEEDEEEEIHEEDEDEEEKEKEI